MRFNQAQQQYIKKLIKKAKAEERGRACKIVNSFIEDILENNEGSLGDLLTEIKGT
jgi:hypothetical protein